MISGKKARCVRGNKNPHRYFKGDGDIVLDLDKVDLVLHGDLLSTGFYRYKIALKSGAVVEYVGKGLITQFKKYLGIEDERS